MARRHWFELHGYAQFTMYSMNIDGLLDDVAHHAGITGGDTVDAALHLSPRAHAGIRVDA